MLRVTVNQKNQYELELNNDGLSVDGKILQPDFVQISPTRYHLILNDKSYRINIIEAEDEKHLVLEVNGNRYTVEIQDKYDILLHDLGMDAGLSAKAVDVKAPMPGLVLEVLVAPGEEVVKDTPLVILEAMKMENVLKAAADSVIDSVLVKAKDAVEKNQVLVTFKS